MTTDFSALNPPFCVSDPARPELPLGVDRGYYEEKCKLAVLIWASEV